MNGPAVGEGRSAARQEELVVVETGEKTLLIGRKLCWPSGQQAPYFGLQLGREQAD